MRNKWLPLCEPSRLALVPDSSSSGGLRLFPLTTYKKKTCISMFCSQGIASRARSALSGEIYLPRVLPGRRREWFQAPEQSDRWPNGLITTKGTVQPKWKIQSLGVSESQGRILKQSSPLKDIQDPLNSTKKFMYPQRARSTHNPLGYIGCLQLNSSI